jgi:replicative DNA helicase
MEITPTAANVRQYVALLRKLHRLRQVQELAQQLATAQQMEDATELAEQISELMVSQQTAKSYTFQELMDGFLEAHDQQPEYLRWGLPVLDEQLTVGPGKFVILGGYPAAGKTALALQFLIYQSSQRQGKRIGVFSYEMDEGTLRDRSVAHHAGYQLGDILNRATAQMDYDRLAPTLRELREQQVRIYPASGMTVRQIRALSVANKFDIVYIDYLQLIRPSSERAMRHEQVAEISRQLTNMAHSTGITVVALSQLSRPEKPVTTNRKPQKIQLGNEIITAPPKLIPVREPTLSDLRESGQLEQDADAILMLWRPYPDSNQITDRFIRIAKNRTGPEGAKLTLRFDGETQRFRAEDRRSLIQRIKDAIGTPGSKPEPEPEPEQPHQMELTELTGEDEELPF